MPLVSITEKKERVMDKDRNYISPRSERTQKRDSYGRRVSSQRGANHYDIDKAREELNEKRSFEKRKREEERRKRKQRMRSLRIRVLLISAVIVLIILILLFLTPLLNIKNISVTGNNIVASEDVLERLDALKGENLLLLSDGKVKGLLSELSYIEDASAAKYLIPPSIKVTVKECTPAARIELNGYNVIINPQLKVLADSNEFDADTLPHIDGLSVLSYNVGKELSVSDNDIEKLDVLKTCLEVMDKLNMIEKTDYIDITDITNIRFGYDDRIDALCGTRLELERKIRMFNVTVNGSSLAGNARGIIDLRTSGRAVYTP